MKKFFNITLILLVGIISCKQKPSKQQTEKLSLAESDVEMVETEELDNDDFTDYKILFPYGKNPEDTEFGHCESRYIVIADTSRNFHELSDKMNRINSEYGIPIEMMGRVFDENTGFIALPDDDKDEMWAGMYYPRHFHANYLSIEYWEFYTHGLLEVEENPMFALVAGMYEEQEKADLLYKRLKRTEPKAFKLKTDIYYFSLH